MKRDITGGYDGDAKRSDERAEYVLERAEYVFSSSITGSLRRNGLGCGLIHCGSEAEFNWLKERIDGIYKPED